MNDINSTKPAGSSGKKSPAAAAPTATQAGAAAAASKPAVSSSGEKTSNEVKEVVDANLEKLVTASTANEAGAGAAEKTKEVEAATEATNKLAAARQGAVQRIAADTAKHTSNEVKEAIDTQPKKRITAAYESKKPHVKDNATDAANKPDQVEKLAATAIDKMRPEEEKFEEEKEGEVKDNATGAEATKELKPEEEVEKDTAKAIVEAAKDDATVVKEKAAAVTTTVSEALAPQVHISGRDKLTQELDLVEHQLARQHSAEKSNEANYQVKENFLTDLQDMDPENVARFGDGVQNTTLLRVLNDDGMERAMSLTKEGQTRDQIKMTKQCLINEMCVLNQAILATQGEHGTCLFLIINLCFCISPTM